MLSCGVEPRLIIKPYYTDAQDTTLHGPAQTCLRDSENKRTWKHGRSEELGLDEGISTRGGGLGCTEKGRIGLREVLTVTITLSGR